MVALNPPLPEHSWDDFGVHARGGDGYAQTPSIKPHAEDKPVRQAIIENRAYLRMMMPHWPYDRILFYALS